MSRERNLETLRWLLELWNALIRDATPEVLERIDPDCEIHGPLASVAGHPYRGSEGVRQWLADIEDQFAVWEVQDQQISPLSDDQFLIFSSIHARGRESGVELDWPAAALTEFRDGRLLRLTIFGSREEALKAVDLE